MLWGGRSSKAGISRFLVEARPRYLLIDDIEKMDMKDHSALISLMETGVVSELLAGRTETVKLKTWVFASANDQSKLPPELRRFMRFNLEGYTYAEDELITIAFNYVKITKRVLVELLAEKGR